MRTVFSEGKRCVSPQSAVRATARAAVRRRAAVAVLVGAVLAPTGLAACTPRPGSAAYVGDDRLTVNQVESDTRAVLAAAASSGQTGLDPAEVNRRQVDRFVTDRLITVAAQRRGITVSDAEVDALIRQAAGTTDTATFADQLAASQLVPPGDLDAFARSVALNQKLVAAIAPGASATAQNTAIVSALGELSSQLGTGVSPRYGAWDPTQLTVALPPDDLSKPAPSATAATSGAQVQQ